MSYFADCSCRWFDCSLNKISSTCISIHETSKELVETTKNKLFKSYSPWTVAEEIVEILRQEGNEVKPIETKKILDLAQLCYQPSYWNTIFALTRIYRTIHVINDKKCIKNILKIKRNSPEYDVYPTSIEAALRPTPHSMLLCPAMNHRRLRKPFEQTFKMENVEKDFSKILIESSFCAPAAKRPITLENLSVESLIRKKAGTHDLSEQELNDSIKTLYAASKVTTTQLCNVIPSLLAIYPEWIQLILTEWDEAYSAESFEINEVTDVAKRFIAGEGPEQPPCQYLHAFVLEVLRIYPALPQLVRIAQQAFELEGQQIAAGDVLVLNILASNMDPKVWGNDASKFHPERFLKENAKPLNILKNALPVLDFSSGSQICIGKYLAIWSLLIETLICASEIKQQLPDCVFDQLEESKAFREKIPLPSYQIVPPFLITDKSYAKEVIKKVRDFHCEIL